MPGTATYIVYKTAAGDGQIRRTSDDTDILPLGQTFDSALQTALDRVVPADKFSGGPGDVYVPAGRYDLADDFAGFVLSSYTNLRLDGRAQLRVPPNYAGPGWLEPVAAAPRAAGPVVAPAPERLDVVTGTDSALHRKTRTGGAWQPSVTAYEYLGGAP